MEFKIVRKEVEFCFRNPKLNKYGNLVFEYKITGIKENDRNEGYFFAAEYLPSKKAIRFPEIKIRGQKVGGVLIDDENLKLIEKFFSELQQKRQQEKEKVVNDICEGRRFIDFRIVGVDYPHYSAWIDLKDFEGFELEILRKALEQFEIEVVDVIEFLNNRLKEHGLIGISTIEKFKEIPAANMVCCSEKQEYHGFKDTVVTSFQFSLSELLKPYLQKKMQTKKEKEKIFEKAKETGQKQLLRKWAEECSDPNESCSVDVVYEWALPDGSVQMERHHTW